MKLGLLLCFKENSLDGRFCAEFIEKYVGFAPEKIILNSYVKDWNEKKHLKKIRECRNLEDLIFISRTSSFMVTDVRSVKDPYQILDIAQDDHSFHPTDTEIETFINIDGFICAYLFDSNYVTQQSARNQSKYEVAGIPLSLAEGIPFTIDEHGHKVFDTSGNPGREDVISSTSLLASWKMWFGKNFYKICPKEKLLNFDSAFSIKELPNDVVYVQLYRDVEESRSQESQKTQACWRQWLDFDNLIKNNP